MTPSRNILAVCNLVVLCGCRVYVYCIYRSIYIPFKQFYFNGDWLRSQIAYQDEIKKKYLNTQTQINVKNIPAVSDECNHMLYAQMH